MKILVNLQLPTFLRNMKKKAQLKKNSDKSSDYEDSKIRKLGKNSFDIFLEKYFPNFSEIEDEDDIVPSHYRISKRGDKEFVDTISWHWFDVSREEAKRNNSQENLSCSSSEKISEIIFLQNDFYFSTLLRH